MNHSHTSLILPKEHGSWALTFEPLTLALLVAPSRNGLLLFLGSVLAFFAHPSARALLASRFTNKAAWAFFLLFSLPAVWLLALFVRLTPYPYYLPLLFGLLLMVLYLLLEAVHLDRVLSTELMASVSMGLIALSIVLAGGMDPLHSLAFLAVLYSRTLLATIYIHYRLLQLKKRLQSFWLNHLLHLLDFVFILYLWQQGLIPLLAWVAVLILTFRAIWTLSVRTTKLTVRKLGFQEVYFGLIFWLLVILGYGFGRWVG